MSWPRGGEARRRGGECVVSMEDPGSWDRLTAALARSSGPAELRWAFLQHLGLVRDDDPAAVARFASILAEVEGRDRLPGPSVALEVRTALSHLATPEAAASDPHGTDAATAWQAWRANAT